MSFSHSIELDTKESFKKTKLNWYWPPVFCVAWFAIFYAVIVSSFYTYPDVLSIKEELKHKDEFIGERAEYQLIELSGIGVKIAGTPENEVQAAGWLRKQIEKIKMKARLDLYDIDVDVQFSSGEFELWKMIVVYHNFQNIIVKISPKGTKSKSFLLVNSHFDSEVGSPAAGDAGVMIVTMLETLRVLSISETPLLNPVVFLFNGAEENKLLGSHGFITKHIWSANVRAVINLDSAGSGGREVLFQSGPGHPWLTRYYGKYVPHPHASTLAEEMFQNNFIPSDTDFRIFRDHKNIPGVDMAHTSNGYVYHTKFDRFSIIPRGTFQTTGDNILALTRALANAPELENPKKHSAGHTIFYDYLGWFTVHYTEEAGEIINITISIVAFISIGISFWTMLREKGQEFKECSMRFLQIFGVQLLTIALAFGLTVLVGVILRLLGLALAWYKDSWMIFGLYYCPMFFIMGIIPAFYLGWTKNKTCMSLNHSVQLFLHSQAIILAVIVLLLTGFTIRSAFLPMVGLFFYTGSLVLNLLATAIFKKKHLWLVIHLICQLPSFLFYSYCAYIFCEVFVAMQGRDGPDSNPELFISEVSALFAVLSAGFLVPVLHFFRKPKIFFSLFAVLTVIYIILTLTPIGFPFVKDVSPKRFYILHTNRIFHEYGGEISRNESGFYVQPVDPREVDLKDSVLKNARPLSYTRENCEKEMFCGLPLSSSRWRNWNYHSRWVPSGMPMIPEKSELKFISKTMLTPTKVRFEFRITGPDRSVVYIDPMPGAKVSDWSFDRNPLEKNYNPPYMIYATYSMELRPLILWIELEREEIWEGPTLRLATSGHMLHHQNYYTDEFKQYLESFPEWVYPTTWIATHESWLF